MITVKFIFGKNSSVTGFEISGHSDYSRQGSDIICASVSSAAYMAANTITDVINLSADIKTDDGYMLLRLCDGDAKKGADILKGFMLHIKELQKEYPQYIKFERGAYNA